MRRVLLRAVAVPGALLMAVSCGWGGQDSDGAGRPPGAPAGVTAAAGSSTSVHVMWNLATGEPKVAHYEVYRGTTKVKEVPGSDHMVDITRLKPSTMYAFSVRARGTDGRLGPPSERVRAATPAATAADERAPSAPKRPHGKAAGSRAAQLSWDKSTDDRSVASYDVYQGDTKIHSVGGAQTATVVTGLRPGTRYSFTVRARDAADNVSPASEAVRITTSPGSDDGKGTDTGSGSGLAPTGFRATTHRTDGAYYLDLAWIPPNSELLDGVITEYQIQLDRQPTTSLVWGGTAPRDKATYSFYVGREAGVTQRVRIRAKLPDGTWGAFSAERTVTTGAARP
ncbi:fibronectin type III domain-containing protein [Streptomyces sp. NBC_00878]|uniref:fibronectin type III domain-containing protein n=1 Tax=Streptomyces sp. NBC_00878 TaxID=2975854 RepID=UPI00225AAE17|nr:fibronectin type III domain-containing protein [Streptomyces sp. NBC_00878]MCX4911101.1 fibronectin type III domain-containing protein [Streptomyces sp. NBC_00878]